LNKTGYNPKGQSPKISAGLKRNGLQPELVAIQIFQPGKDYALKMLNA
jgi:hypothetical protein